MLQVSVSVKVHAVRNKKAAEGRLWHFWMINRFFTVYMASQVLSQRSPRASSLGTWATMDGNDGWFETALNSQTRT
jgi:hypothetical protein